MTARWNPAVVAAALVGLSWILLATFWAAPGVFNVDGIIYQAMIDSFSRSGSLFIENGYEFYPSPTLRLEYTVASEGGLAPQYPGGWGILASPAYLAGGLRGVIIVNAVASALTVLMVWIAARALFDDRGIAATATAIYGFATFAVDYAISFWPHASTTFLVTAAFAATARAMCGDERSEFRRLILAGLAVGVAVNIRVDAILAAGGLGIWIMAMARRPWTAVAASLLGLLPGLVAASAINYLKFGTLSPFSYGASKGNASLAGYFELLPFVIAAAVAVLALGLKPVRAAVFRPVVQAVLLGLVLAALLSIPSLRDAAARLARSVYILLVDFQAHSLPGWGLSMEDDGTIRAWGLRKKALFQSLPYAAAMIVVLPRAVRGPGRAAIAACLLFCLPFVLFFSLNTWHGGSNNMRYFLNFVPEVAILSAVAIHEIWAVPGRRRTITLATELVLVSAAIGYATWRGFSTGFVVEHTLPTAIEAAIAITAVVFLIARDVTRAAVASVLEGLVVLGLATAIISAWVFDVQVGQRERQASAEMNELVQALPPDAIVMTYVTSHAGFRVNRPPAITAKADNFTGAFDPDFVALAFASGRPLYAQDSRLARRMIAQGAASAAEPTFGIEDSRELYLMAPPQPGGKSKAGNGQ